MSLNYLLDENVDPSYKTEILTRNLDLIIWCMGEPEAPSRGTLDPDWKTKLQISHINLDWKYQLFEHIQPRTVPVINVGNN